MVKSLRFPPRLFSSTYFSLITARAFFTVNLITTTVHTIMRSFLHNKIHQSTPHTNSNTTLTPPSVSVPAFHLFKHLPTDVQTRIFAFHASSLLEGAGDLVVKGYMECDHAPGSAYQPLRTSTAIRNPCDITGSHHEAYIYGAEAKSSSIYLKMLLPCHQQSFCTIIHLPLSLRICRLARGVTLDVLKKEAVKAGVTEPSRYEQTYSLGPAAEVRLADFRSYQCHPPEVEAMQSKRSKGGSSGNTKPGQGGMMKTLRLKKSRLFREQIGRAHV